MALGPRRAEKALPPTANIAAIIAALGSSVTEASYRNGVLHVRGISQATLDNATADVDLIHGYRAIKKQEAQQQLASRTAAGMMWSGRPLQIDDLSVVRITAGAVAADLGALPEGFAWRMADNTALPMDEAGMIAMATAAFSYVFALRTRYWQIVDAVDAAADEAALAAINLATGWPAPPG